ncbi:MAG TPA: Ig-like domain-containing protein [Candidatus Acidoferrales bacterium]
MNKKFLIFIALVAIVALTGCGYTGSNTSGNIGKIDVLSVNMAKPTPNPILPGVAVQFVATGLSSDGKMKVLTDDVTWTSSNPAVATITSGGLLTTLSDGSTVISATFRGIVSSYVVIVGDGSKLQSIAVSPGNPSVAPGTTLPFVAQGTYSDGSVRNISSTVVWTSSNRSAATINVSGVATALAQGSTTITAASDTVQGSTTLTVTAATISTIAVSPSNPSLAAGSVLQFHAIATFNDGSQQDVTSVVNWTSSNTSTATITSTGAATGVAAGNTTITATANGGATNSTNLHVTAATLTSITISPSNPSFHSGTNQQFTATAHYSDGSSANITSSVTWTSSAPGTVSIDANGLATGVSSGNATITATSGTTTGMTSVTIQQATLNSISISPSNPSVAPQTTQQFTATGNYADGSMQDITSSVVWASSNTNTATINSAGLATALASGTTAISATSGSTSANTQLSVTGATVVSLAVSPSNPTFAAGTTLQFTAIATYSDGSMQNVTTSTAWSSDMAAVSIDANGLATGNSPGSATLTASFGGSNTTTFATVSNATVTSLVVGPANPSLAVGTTIQLSATAFFSDGTRQDVTTLASWNSSGFSASVSSSGLVTALSTGSANITANYQSQVAGDTVTITPATLVSIAITPSNPTFASGTMLQFHATGTYSDESTQDITSSVSWTAGSNATVSISSSGLATANSPGSTTITASSGSTSQMDNVTSSPATVNSLTISPSSASIAAGTTQQFTASGNFSDGSTQDVTTQVAWTTSNANASINANGLATGYTAGTSTVQATLGAQGNTAALTITNAVLQSITIMPANPTAAAGNSQGLTATGNYSDGTTQDLTKIVNWTSSDTTTAQVNTSGVVTTTKAGSVTITATDMAVTKSVTFVVSAPTLSSVTVTPANPSAAVGQSEQLTATANFTDGSTLDVTNSATWTSDTPAVATVNSTGLVTAVNTGSAGISATYQGVTGGVTFTSGQAVAVSISISPSNPSVAAGDTQQLTANATFSNGTMMDVTSSATWTTSDATLATVSSTGLVTAVKTGMPSITAQFGAAMKSVTVNVTGANLVSLAVSPQNPTAPRGTAEQFAATGSYSDGSMKDITASVTWTSTTTNVATIDSNGLASARSVGSSTIAAAMGTFSDSTTLNVSAATLTSIDVVPVASSNNLEPDVKNANARKNGRFAAPSTGSSRARAAQSTPRANGLIDPVIPFNLNAIVTNVAVGTEQQFQAIGTFSDGSTHDLTPAATWSSTLAGVASVNPAGLATALAVGTTQIQATQSSLVGATTLNVTPAILTSIAIIPSNDTAYVGMNVQYIATGIFSDGSTQDITALVNWTSSDSAIAIIDSSTGVATAFFNGNTTITASQGLTSSSTQLTVAPAFLIAIAVEPPLLNLPVGVPQQYTAIGTYSDGSTHDLTRSAMWSSTLSSVATITPSGLATTVGFGPTTINATVLSANGIALLTVTPATLQSITISLVASAPSGVQLQAIATGTYSDGSTADITSSVSWSSTNPATAIVSEQGVVSALLSGFTYIGATDPTNPTLFGSVLLQVLPTSLISLVVTPTLPVITVGESQQFTATGTYDDLSTQDLTTQVLWSSGSPLVATVNANGLASTSGIPGIVPITATSNAIVSVPASLTVENPVLLSITITPASPACVVGGLVQLTATGNYMDGSMHPLTDANWFTTNPAAATVSPAGLVSCLQPIAVNVGASVGLQSGQQPLSISNAALQSISITPNPASCLPLGIISFDAMGHYADGSSMDVTAQASGFTATSSTSPNSVRSPLASWPVPPTSALPSAASPARPA